MLGRAQGVGGDSQVRTYTHNEHASSFPSDITAFSEPLMYHPHTYVPPLYICTALSEPLTPSVYDGYIPHIICLTRRRPLHTHTHMPHRTRAPHRTATPHLPRPPYGNSASTFFACIPGVTLHSTTLFVYPTPPTVIRI